MGKAILFELLEVLRMMITGGDPADTLKAVDTLKETLLADTTLDAGEMLLGVVIERLAYWNNIKETFKHGETEAAQIAPYIVQELQTLLTRTQDK